jgi:hypothetical protein
MGSVLRTPGGSSDTQRKFPASGHHPGAADEQVLNFAIENGRVLVTLDADFASVIRFLPKQTPGAGRLKVSFRSKCIRPSKSRSARHKPK